ncbi:hypothetical protein VTO42DRAFT_7080 [Malbranchea cinnamomea]
MPRSWDSEDDARCTLVIVPNISVIHHHPETAFTEHHAHDIVCDLLEEQGFQVKRHAYGLETAFEVRKVSGTGVRGRCVNFNMEYDALPELGHACGHNLIATAGLTGFLALSYVMDKFGVNRTVQLLGTPAEEAGGGKVLLLERGAFTDVDVSLMVHPMAADNYVRKHGAIGCAGTTSTARSILTCEFRGTPAHASTNPWDGQIHPEERIHGAILDASKVLNVIPEYTKLQYAMRSPTLKGVQTLEEKAEEPLTASTDQGNVTHTLPGLHGLIGIPTAKGEGPHTHDFAVAAGKQDAGTRFINAGTAMAMTGWSVLVDDEVYFRIRGAFEEDKRPR